MPEAYSTVAAATADRSLERGIAYVFFTMIKFVACNDTTALWRDEKLVVRGTIGSVWPGLDSS
jgi:hypothetical protein